MEKRIKTRILLAEDDENLGSLLREYLQIKNYEVDWVPDGNKAIGKFGRNHYDICILDVMMPLMDGFTLASEIRILSPEMPVIFLTAKSMKEDVLEGFKHGADDYITKPFSMEELVFRIEAILRRIKGFLVETDSVYHIGTFSFHPHKQLALKNVLPLSLYLILLIIPFVEPFEVIRFFPLCHREIPTNLYIFPFCAVLLIFYYQFL